MKKLVLSLALVACLGGCKDKPSMSIHAAARSGNLQQFEKHFKAGTDLDGLDEDGNSPLVLAAQQGHTKAVGRMIERGADVNMKTRDGTTPLFVAAGHPRVAALLEENGAREDPMMLLDRMLKAFDVLFALLAEYPDDCDKALA